MMADNQPLVSIGMPVRNEERYIAQALDSLLAQDYENFELIISDNASEDATQKICLEYAARDRRICYYRNETNMGAIKNFNKVFEISKGEYFMWAGAHDLWDKNFISTCLGELLDDPKVVLCAAQYRLIDEKSTPIEIIPAMDTHGVKPAERLRCVLRQRGSFCVVYGLIRAEALKRTRLFTECYGMDGLLVAELSLLGEFGYAPNAGMYMRIMRDRHLTEDENVIRLVGHSATKMNGRILGRFPFSQFVLGMCEVICRAHIPFTAKAGLIPDVITKFKWSLIKELATKVWPRRLRQSLKRILLRRFPHVYGAWQRLEDAS